MLSSKAKIRALLQADRKNLFLHSVVILLLMLFAAAFSINQVAAIAAVFVVFIGWLIAPLYWLATAVIILVICLSVYLSSHIVLRRLGALPYPVQLLLCVGSSTIISTPVAVGMYRLFLYTGF